MFGLFRRSLPRTPHAPRRASLRLESLEWRDQPSDTPLGTPPPGQELYAAPANAAPAIEDYAAREVTNGSFRITGRVVDEAPGSLTITFGGATSAGGKTVVTAADGTFSLIHQFAVDGTDCGFLTAQTVDAQGVASERVMKFIDPTPA